MQRGSVPPTEYLGGAEPCTVREAEPGTAERHPMYLTIV